MTTGSCGRFSFWLYASSVQPFFDSLAAVVFVWEFYARLSLPVFMESSTIIRDVWTLLVRNTVQ